ncbi:hypothetical protein NMG60_11033051 [Bertholletia excelsa]
MGCLVQLLQVDTGSPSFSKTHHVAAVPDLGSCSTMAEVKQHHSQIIRLGLSCDNNSMGKVIKFCALSRSGDLAYAVKVFGNLPRPDAFIYNILIRGHLQCQLPRNCILFYSQMLKESIRPNRFTFPSVIRAACVDHAVEEAKQVHAHILKFGFRSDNCSLNNLIHMYVNFQFLEDARRVFDTMPHRDIISWTTLISGYSQWGLVDEAFQIFESMPERSSATWNAMISAYVQSNRFQEAFALFSRMLAEKIELDKYVAASMLSACTGLGALKMGEWIHGCVKKSGIELDSKLATSIIDMYSKCGCLEKAVEIFHGLGNKGISSWNAMIGGLALHGKGKAAIEHLKEMERDKPRLEHFGCMVDLLGRAGFLEEAKKLIDEMPICPDSSVLGALLGACRIHGNFELGKQIGDKVIKLEPFNSGRYVLLANLHANAGRWEDVAHVRKLMNDRGVKKPSGGSVIELEGFVHQFVSGGDHPQAKEVYAKVDEMLKHVRSSGYVPVIDEVLHDIDEEEREKPLFYHSEKLAIALGLMKTKPGETFHITKNLRICKDCHTVSKLVSKIYDRKIIVRDRNRFHHFSGGECSCNDYW